MAGSDSFVSSGICMDCTKLVRDVLSCNTRPDTNWTTYRSEYAKLSVGSHLDGSTKRLLESAKDGCKLCKLISQKLPEIVIHPPKEVYSIFVWQPPNPASKSNIQITTEPVDTFVKHVSKWRKPPSFTLYGRRTLSFPSQKIETKAERAASMEEPCVSLMPAAHQGSRENFEQAANWLQKCRSNHPKCARTDTLLPNRIVRLKGSDGNLRLSLLVTKSERMRYTAVSYSWGTSDRIVTMQSPEAIPPDTISRNGTYVIEQRNPRPGNQNGYESLRFWDPADIPLEAFPATLRDSILIAQRLDFQYIWIDSLCIVQDSDSDWADQVAKLTYIYSGADLVISAADAETSTSGILNEIPTDRPKIGTWVMDAGTYDIHVGDPVGILDLERKFLSTRGWVFQERLVSPASLHYSNEGLVWECAQGIQTSHDQRLYAVSWKTEWNDLCQEKCFNRSERRSAHPMSKTPNEIWYNWISAYSARDFYDETDKFPAIAGITRRFAQTFNLTYIAGLWGEDFLSGLTWVRHNRNPTLTRYREKYVAPSWSWASVHGRLEHRNVQLLDSMDERKGPMLKVLQYNVKEARTLTNGERSYETLRPGAMIVLNGVLQPITVDRKSQPGPRTRPYQHCGVSDGFLNPENVVCTLDEYDVFLPFDELPRYYRCWCLRVASYQSGKREGDLFLLLDGREGENVFHRVGFAETEPYLNIKTPIPHSGVFETVREPTTIVVV